MKLKWIEIDGKRYLGRMVGKTHMVGSVKYGNNKQLAIRSWFGAQIYDELKEVYWSKEMKCTISDLSPEDLEYWTKARTTAELAHKYAPLKIEYEYFMKKMER